MKKFFAGISALLSLCLLATPVSAAEPAPEEPVIFSFEAIYVGDSNPSGTPAPTAKSSSQKETVSISAIKKSPNAPTVTSTPSCRNEIIVVPKVEDTTENPAKAPVSSPEETSTPNAAEQELPVWVKGYIHDPSGFDYPEIDLQAFADEIFRLANEERVKAGLPEVERREDIVPVTTIRAKELSELFSHTRPNGEGYMSLMDEYGIEYKWAGENGAKVPATSSPARMMNGWMNSEGHKKNILNPKHTGLEIGVYQVGQMVYCSQMFVY